MMPEVTPLPEPHYSPRVLAEVWGVSEGTIVNWFCDEPGVLKLQKQSKNGNRTRCGLRIPKSIAERVYKERTR